MAMHSDTDFGDSDYGLETLLAHLGEEERPHGAVVPPIFQNSLFTFASSEELIQALERHPIGPPHHYSRISNPSVTLAEQKIAALEGAEACKAVGCGMAAITAAVAHFAKSGSHAVVPDTAYGPVRMLLERYLDRFGVSVSYVSGLCTEEIFDAIRPETTMVYLESPSSILFRMQDIRAVTAECKRRGIRTVIDNTYNTPLHLKPHELGVDIVCHSATKYLGGHSDITAGAITGSKELIDAITMREVNLMGNVLHPFPAWLLVRGMRTLPLRVKAHEAAANRVAAWLEERPEVARVHHISLPSYPQRDLYLRDFKGSGGLFSFEPRVQDREKVLEFCDRLKLFGRGISWGGFESLVVPLRAQPADYREMKWVVRLFIGLETTDDLIADLERAMPALA